MRTIHGLVLAALAVSVAPQSALALSQGKHRDLSAKACDAQKLPSEFCTALGAAAYNVDHYEWEDLKAHAQPEAGQSKCEAANATLGRIRDLAQQLRTIAASSTSYDPALAETFGRVLHTLQDNCAHSGMPNPQHAWFSLSDSCLDTNSSPDTQPEAVTCAEQQTALALQTFVGVIQVPEPPPPPDPERGNNNSNPYPQLWPSRGGVCDFLKGAATWDGMDRRWNNQTVVPALADQLTQTLVVNVDAPASDLCAAGASVVEPPASAPPVDTSVPIEWCTKLELYCVGKADDTDEAPPWEPTTTSTSESSSGDGSGCSLRSRGRPESGGWAALGLLALLAAARRRAADDPGTRCG